MVSGLKVASQCFTLVDPQSEFQAIVDDGTFVPAGTMVAQVSGSSASVLKAERTALNFLQHLSGVATHTHCFVERLADLDKTLYPARVVHTRKTTPGMRLLEGQAVVDGGGSPHRYNLGSAVMLKDNHLTQCSISEAVAQIRERVSHMVVIEVEVDRLTQIAEALEAGADVIMLDNMPPEKVTEGVKMIGNRAKTEASGNISLDTVREYALTGVQFLSTSKITLGAPALDIGLDFLCKI